MSRRRHDMQMGFTLLEVMVAMAILAMSLTVIAQAQTNSVRAVGRSKQLTIATMLAREKMVEVEEELFGEVEGQGFSEFEEEKKGDFSDQGFARFRYLLKIEKVELPTNIDEQAVSAAAEDVSGEEQSSGQGGGMYQMGAQMLSQQFEMFRTILEQSIRRVTLRVSWTEGGGKKGAERFLTVNAYFTDPSKVDIAGGQIDAAKRAGAGGQQGPPGSSTPQGSTSGSSGGSPTSPSPVVGGGR